MSANRPNQMNATSASTADLLREKYEIERRLKAINDALDMVMPASREGASAQGQSRVNGVQRVGRWDSK